MKLFLSWICAISYVGSVQGNLFQSEMSDFAIMDEVTDVDTPFECFQGYLNSKIKYKILKNQKTNEYVKIAVSLGGLVDDVCLVGASGEAPCLNVLKTVDDLSESCEYSRNGLLAPYANRIDNGTYSFYGTTNYLPRTQDGNVNSIHGFLQGKMMEVVDENTNEEGASLSLGYVSDGSEPGYPFELGIKVHYTLSETGLSITITATNPDPNGYPAPYYVGWHPYFAGVNPIDQIAVKFDSCAKWGHLIVTPVLIPTGPVDPSVPDIPLGDAGYDDGYKATATNRCGPKLCTCIENLYDGESTVVRQPVSNQFVQVFDGARNWGWDSVAVEPMSGATNAYNSGDGLTVISGLGGKMETVFEVLNGKESAKHCGGCAD